jgi:hypothetical protein
MYASRASLSAVGGTTSLISTSDDTSVWKNREIAIAKYDPTDPNNCYTNWTEDMTYPMGATLCDGIIFTCLDPALCGKFVPGSGNASNVWSTLEGATVPASQTKTYEYYTRTATYGIGDFAISRIDQKTYKCINAEEGNCQNNPPAGSEYWTILVVKALNPAELGIVYNGWSAQNRYQSGDLIGFSTTDTVYKCLFEAFCQYHPTEDSNGAIGWESTFFRVPDGVAENTPPKIVFDGTKP